MARPQLYLPERFKVACGKVGQCRRFQQLKKKNGSFKRKGMERWHRAVSTNLVKQNVLVPKEESSSDSDMGFHESQQNQKKKLMKKMKTAFGRMLSYKHRNKPATASKEGCTNQKEALLSNTQSLLPRIIKELPSPKLFTKPKMRKLTENGNQRQFIIVLRQRGIVPYSPKKRPHFPALKKKKHGMENILRKSDLTVGKLQMQVLDKGFYFCVSELLLICRYTCFFFGDRNLLCCLGWGVMAQ
uniref:Chromosome 3 open reading frame 49 n=1 Tax=Propithecus coquereli TaxID=379532 RepID=A0A2K6F8A3_PROCO